VSAPDFIDTSVLVAAMIASERHHGECVRLLDSGPVGFHAHGIAETFGTLTGGRAAFRLRARAAMELLEEDYLPCLKLAVLDPARMLAAMREAESRGVRGGAIFDYLHLVTAREAGARRIYTLSVSNFRAFHRPGDPEIALP
jgi:predicted nucleic acid-binding protein